MNKIVIIFLILSFLMSSASIWISYALNDETEKRLNAKVVEQKEDIKLLLSQLSRSDLYLEGRLRFHKGVLQYKTAVIDSSIISSRRTLYPQFKDAWKDVLLFHEENTGKREYYTDREGNCVSGDCPENKK